ncbi:hypothetical protein M0802_008746 [Mischocyttarus mexicanus]|nr:hypothetical protein M0802_008746 [Mischocyttarus mexicanus]
MDTVLDMDMQHWIQGQSTPKFATASLPAEFLIRLYRPLTTNLLESTFDLDAVVGVKACIPIFLMVVHADGVETPIVQRRLQC